MIESCHNLRASAQVPQQKSISRITRAVRNEALFPSRVGSHSVAPRHGDPEIIIVPAFVVVQGRVIIAHDLLYVYYIGWHVWTV